MRISGKAVAVLLLIAALSLIGGLFYLRMKTPEPQAETLHPKEDERVWLDEQLQQDGYELLLDEYVVHHSVELIAGQPCARVGGQVVYLPRAPKVERDALLVDAQALLTQVEGQFADYEYDSAVTTSHSAGMVPVQQLATELDLNVYPVSPTRSLLVSASIAENQVRAFLNRLTGNVVEVGQEAYMADDGLFDLTYITDAFGISRPAPSQALARRSLELSAMIYGNNFDTLIAAGWTDIHIVEGGNIVARPDPALSHLGSIQRLLEYKQNLLQRETNRTIVSARKLSSGKAVVSVVFCGTRSFATQWLDNLSFTTKDGLHEGFLGLADSFASAAGSIAFPELSRIMQEEHMLTLQDILIKTRELDSDYLLYITGHSQGAAVTQVYVAHNLENQAVNFSNVIAYTIAPPLVADYMFEGQVAQYPVYNIVNTDDIITKVGGEMRMGADLFYTPDADFRETYYQPYDAAMERDVAFSNTMQNMSDVIEMINAMVKIQKQRVGGALNPQNQALRLLMEEVLASIQPINSLYRDYYGYPPLPGRVAFYSDKLKEQYGESIVAPLEALSAVAKQAHPLRDVDHPNRNFAYNGIVEDHFDSLEMAIWLPGRLPLSTFEGANAYPIPHE